MRATSGGERADVVTYPGEPGRRQATVDAVPDVVVEECGPVTRLTLSRPERRNALSLELMRSLTAALRAASGRVVVLAGEGPAFSAGHDLGELVDADTARHAEIFAACTELMETVQSIDQPVIAEVHGVATAAGCQLVASCDLAVAERGARFGTPGVRIGLFCSTPMVPLSRAIGPKRAMQLLLTGDLLDAATAVEWGLINEVVEPDELRPHVQALAERIASASPLTLAIGKRTFHRQLGLDQHQAYDLAAATMVANAATCDAKEGMTAFLEKRTPTWTGT
jgi:enoyl-CoA hydratase/carnithine racemase